MEISQNNIVNKLFDNQLKNINQKYRLSEKDIIRLASYIDTDPFHESQCCLWKGSVSISSHQSKYINFWFNKKKQALHRILYINYKGELSNTKYLRFTCEDNKMRGICCNINHIDIINKIEEIDTDKKEKQVEKLNIVKAVNNLNKNNFILVFDDD